jgi:hypothetical protein
MKKTIFGIIAVLAIGFNGYLFAEDNCSMQVAPSAITLGSVNEPAQITLHTDVTYSEVSTLDLVACVDSEEVDDECVELEIESTFSDNRGQLVVRVDWRDDDGDYNEDILPLIDKLKDGAIEVEFELSGMAADEPFECEDEVRVIAVKKP